MSNIESIPSDIKIEAVRGWFGWIKRGVAVATIDSGGHRSVNCIVGDQLIEDAACPITRIRNRGSYIEATFSTNDRRVIIDTIEDAFNKGLLMPKR